MSRRPKQDILWTGAQKSTELGQTLGVSGVLKHQKTDSVPKISSYPSVKDLLNLSLNYANILAFLEGKHRLMIVV